MKSTHFACFALSLLAGSAAAQPGGVFASGLEHDALGSTSSLTVNGRRLNVCCLGSSGQDGVELKLDSAWGGRLDVDMTNWLAVGKQLRIRHKGWDGTIKGVSRISGTSSGANCTIDYTSVGAIGINYTLLDSQGHVTSQGTSSGPTIDWNVNGPCLPGQTAIWGYGWHNDPVLGWTFSMYLLGCYWNVVGPFVGPPTISDLRTISFTPILPAGSAPIDGCAAIDLTGKGFPEIQTTEADLYHRSLLCWGEGAAHLGEVCDDPTGACAINDRRLVVSNIGSSGQDGVEIKWDGIAAEAHTDLSAMPSGPGQTLTPAVLDDAGTTISSCTFGVDALTGVHTITPDFSGLGATHYQVECLDDGGHTLGTYNLALGVGFPYAIMPGCDRFWHASYVVVGNKWFFVGCVYDGDPNGFYGPPHPGCTQMVVTALDPTHSPPARSLRVTAAGMSSFELASTDITGYCPSDFNQDGFTDIYDFTDFVTCFEGAACPPGTSADFNGDGFADIYDFTDFVTAFETGC